MGAVPLGVCLDNLNPKSVLDPFDSNLWYFTTIRDVARDDQDFFDRCKAMTDVGYELGLIIGAESFPGGEWRGGEDQVTHLLENLQPKYWIIGNECDAGWNINPETGQPYASPSSWVMEPDDYSEFATMCHQIIRERQPDAVITGCGLISGQPAWVMNYTGPRMDLWDIHSYVYSDTEALRQYILTYRQACQCPIAIFEWFRPAVDIPWTMEVLQKMEIMNTFFCWTDGMVAPFGLFDDQGNPKPEFYALIGEPQP